MGRALLDDAHTQIEQLNAENPSKTQIKKLKADCEEINIELQSNIRSKKQIQAEYDDLQNQLNEALENKTELEEIQSSLKREINNNKTHIEEVEEEQEDLSRKLKNSINQNSELQKNLIETQSRADQYRMEKQDLNERLLALENKVNFQNANFVDKSEKTKLDMKLREIDTKLDFEKSTNKRLENSICRLKEQAERYQQQIVGFNNNENRNKDQLIKLQKNQRALQDDNRDLERLKVEALNRAMKADSDVDDLRTTVIQTQADLKIAMKRIADLTTAFEDLENSDFDSDDLLEPQEKGDNNDAKSTLTVNR